MDLFIETPQRYGAGAEVPPIEPDRRAGGREDHSAREAGRSAPRSAFFSSPARHPSPVDSDRSVRALDGTGDAGPGYGEYSVAQSSYRDELAYERLRTRRRRLGQAVRALLLLVGIPVVLGVIFLASYALTCILNGATPQEVVVLFGSLFSRLGGFARHIA